MLGPLPFSGQGRRRTRWRVIEAVDYEYDLESSLCRVPRRRSALGNFSRIPKNKKQRAFNLWILDRYLPVFRGRLLLVAVVFFIIVFAISKGKLSH